MNKELLQRVKKGFLAGRGADEIRSSLAAQGFLEDDILSAIQEVKGQAASEEEKKNNTIFAFKEVFDRIGYGFSSTQFINILFYIIGAGFFVIGTVNGLKAVLSLLISSIMQEYAKVRRVSVKFLSKSGVLFGLSFLFIALAITLKSVPLFSIALLVGAVGVVTYGDLYERLAEQHLRRERLGRFMLNISQFGIIITGVSMILSGILFDRFPIFGAEKILIFGRSLPLYGFLICFEITAITLILSGYVLHFVKEKASSEKQTSSFLSLYYLKVREQARLFIANKHLVLLLFAGSITGLVQVLGNSYYGIFIYQKFMDGTFTGLFSGVFLNIAFIFLFALVVSFLGPVFSGYLNRRVGLAPSLVFGSLLVAMMPLVAVYNPNFMPLLVANALGIVGAALLGIGQGLLVRKLLRESQRGLFYAVMGIGVAVPFLVFVPAGAFLAQAAGLVALFKVLAFVMLLMVAPIYFALVVMASKQRL